MGVTSSKFNMIAVAGYLVVRGTVIDAQMAWTEDTSSPLVSWWAVAMSGDGTIQTAAVGGDAQGNIWRSTNSGATWIENTSSPGAVKSWTSIAMSNLSQQRSRRTSSCEVRS